MKISIKSALITGFIGLVSLSVIFIIVSSHMTTKKVLLEHANQIMENIVKYSIDNTGSHILPAKDAARLTKGLATNMIVSSENSSGMERYFYEQLLINKQFSGIYYGNEKGEFVMVSRTQEDGSLGYLTKIINIKNKKRTVTLKYSNTQFEHRKSVILDDDTYDPTKRPWYKKAKEKQYVIWTHPYIFFTSKKPGISTASPVFLNNGKMQGVVGVDIEISEMSRFLSRLKIGKNGKAFIMDSKGQIIAYPDMSKIKIKENNDKFRLAQINEINDPLTKEAYKAFFSNYKNKIPDGATSIAFEYEDKTYHAMFAPFNTLEWPWIIGIFIPEEDILGEIKNNQNNNILISILIGLFACLIGLRMARGIAKPISDLEKAASELKDINLDTECSVDSFYKEISEAAETFNKMQSSLKDYDEQNKRLHHNLNDAHLDTLYRLAVAAEYKDTDTSDHVHRISQYTYIIGERLGLTPEELNILKYASIMHDVGKLGIPDNILMKPGKLDKDERTVIETHTEIGGKILDKPSSDIMWAAKEIALTHHEKWDGSGYPNGLKERAIPIYGRITAVADVFDALVSKRCYKDAMPVEKALAIIEEGKGTHFDPECVEAFLSQKEKVFEIHEIYGEDNEACKNLKIFTNDN